jgi:hypothetical protein
MDRATVEEHLAEADAHIADAEARITRQREIVAKCSAAGISTTDAEDLLAELTYALRRWCG